MSVYSAVHIICNFSDAPVGFHSTCHNPVIDRAAVVNDSDTRWHCRVCTYRQTASPVSKSCNWCSFFVCSFKLWLLCLVIVEAHWESQCIVLLLLLLLLQLLGDYRFSFARCCTGVGMSRLLTAFGSCREIL